MKVTPVYRYPGSYAEEHGELGRYRESFQVNVACKEAIEDAISRHYFNNSLHAEAVAEVVEIYGFERTLYVLANTVQHKDWDARFSMENKNWAKTIPIPEDPCYGSRDRTMRFIVDKVHPGLVDLFLTQTIKLQAMTQKGQKSTK